MKKLLFSIVILFSLNIYSQKERRVITTAVPFLLISSDARASGVGEQGVATSFDNFSQHWNPSKYVFAENSSGFGFSYTPYLSKIVNDVFLGNLTYFRKNSERSAWSFSLKYFSLGEIDILQNPLDIPVIESPNEFTLDAAYSLKLNDNFGLGVAGRFLLSDVKLQSFDSESQASTSVAVDISGFFKSDVISLGRNDGILRAGFNISNLGPKMKYSDLGQENFIPSNLRIGSGFEFLYDSNNSLSITIEVNKLLVPTPNVPIYDSSNSEIIAYKITQIVDNGNVVQMTLVEDVQTEPLSQKQLIMENVSKKLDTDTKQQVMPLLEAILQAQPTIKLKSYAQTSVAITLPKNRYEKMGRPQVGQKLQVDLKII